MSARPALAWSVWAWHGLEPGMASQGHALWPEAYGKAWVQSLVLTAATATAAGAAWLDGTNAGNSLNVMLSLSVALK